MINAPYLIAEWERIHKLLTPSPVLFRRSTVCTSVSVETQDNDPLNHLIGEISLLSSRRDAWEASVGLVDYAQKNGRVPSQVLGEIQFQPHFEDTNLWSDEPYFRHCKELSSLSLEVLIPAAYLLKLFFREGIVFNHQNSLEDFEECYREYYPNWTEIQACLIRKGP